MADLYFPLNVNSKFAICGLPLRVDTYTYCTFGCKYCFANNRITLKTNSLYKDIDFEGFERKLEKVLVEKSYTEGDFLSHLLEQDVTWHCGGMADPFQPLEKEKGNTKRMVDIANKYDRTILFSTKSDNLYDVDVRPNLHTFQMSVTNTLNDKRVEENVPTIESRYKLYRELKDNGFKVGIRIQPFIPNVTTLDIIDMFHDADNFTLEGLKLVPNNIECYEDILKVANLNVGQFVNYGLMNLKPKVRWEMYKPFIKRLEELKLNYSLADNDFHHIGTNKCCCGDCLITKSTEIDSTYMSHCFGRNYKVDDVIKKVEEKGLSNCKCSNFLSSHSRKGRENLKKFFQQVFVAKNVYSSSFLCNTDNFDNELTLFDDF